MVFDWSDAIVPGSRPPGVPGALLAASDVLYTQESCDALVEALRNLLAPPGNAEEFVTVSGVRDRPLYQRFLAGAVRAGLRVEEESLRVPPGHPALEVASTHEADLEITRSKLSGGYAFVRILPAP